MHGNVCDTTYPISLNNVRFWAFPHHTATKYLADHIVQYRLILWAIWYRSITHAHYRLSNNSRMVWSNSSLVKYHACS